jgi:hypothetical protein
MPRRERAPRFGAPLRWTLWILAVVLVVWFVATGVLLVQAGNRASDGIDGLDRAREELTTAKLLQGDGRDALVQAEADFEDAHDIADNPVLAPWGVVPLAGGNVRSVEALTAAARDVARIGAQAAADSQAALEASPAAGADRLAQLDRLADIADRARRKLQSVDLGPDFFLVGPVGDARERFERRLRQLRDALADAAIVTRATRQLLAGPRRYLLVAANNAEMRAGSGTFLSLGVADFADGNVTIGDLQPSSNFNLPAGAVTPPPELEALWGWVHPSQEWRNLATSPRFDVTAPLAAQMWQAATGQAVDGVLAVDPVAVQALLAAQGAVVVEGQTLDAANVLQYLFLDQYAGLGADVDQAARRDQLSAVARAAIDTLQSRPWDGPALAEQLTGVGQGRHVLAWSSDPVEQQGWEAAGIDGAMEPESLLVALLNVGANKLDQFLDVDARLEHREVADGGIDVTVKVTVRNDAPADLPPYVSGPDPSTDLVAGLYRGIVAVSSPGVGSHAEIDGAGVPLVDGIDGPTRASAVGYLEIPRGESRTVEVRFRLPAGFEALRVEPSARVPPITWHSGHTTWQDTQPRTQRVAAP